MFEAISYSCRGRPTLRRNARASAWDSGWRFFADDDDNSEEGRLMFRSLGFACDLFPEVRRILDLPYGTAFIRGEDGILHPYDEDDEEEL